MAFPYNQEGQPNTQQAILAGVTGVSASNQGFFRVSTLNSISVTAISANQQLSAQLLGGTSFIGDVSALSPDAGLFRISALGSGGNVLSVGGQTDGLDQGLTPFQRVNSFGMGFNGNGVWDRLRTVSASGGGLGVQVVGSVDAGLFRVSGFSPDAGLFLVSAKSGDGAQLRVSAIQDGAAALNVSAKSNDGALFRTSAFIDSGSVSAKSADANQIHVSAVQGDGALFRVSTFGSVVATNTGGASLYFTSTATTSQVSTVKSTAGRLYGYHFGNPAGVDQYVQIFNASGGATAGTDAPALSLYVPTLGGAVVSLGDGIGFSNGIQFITTSTVNGQTVGASGVRVNFFYA